MRWRPGCTTPARALQAGQLSPEQFRSIEGGLGRPQQDVTVAMLAGAAARLVEAARELDADALRSLAAELRDELDEAGIADREAALVENDPSASRGCPTA